MLLTTAIKRIKNESHDISDEYSNEECVSLLNTAVQRVYGLMVGYGYPPIVREIDLHEDDSLPHNYMKSCGTYPIRVTNNIIHLLEDGVEYVRFRYFANPEMMVEDTEALPFDHDGVNEIILKVAVNLALNRNEYDISQDTALLQDLQQAIAMGMGAGT